MRYENQFGNVSNKTGAQKTFRLGFLLAVPVANTENLVWLVAEVPPFSYEEHRQTGREVDTLA